MTIKQMEKQLILKTLAENENNIKKTARDLDIGLATLYRKIKEYKFLTPKQARRKCTGRENTSQYLTKSSTALN